MDYIKSEWNGFERIDFKFEGRNAILVLPKEPIAENKWLYKIEYFEAFPEFEIEMLKRGYYLAHVSNKSRLCPDEDTNLRPRFCKFLKEKFGLNEKCLTVGMSCGGMQAVYFAAKYPKYVAAIYIDAPVLNLLSWPLGLGKSQHPSIDEFNAVFNIPISEMLSYTKHPINFKEKLLKTNIPVFLVGGDSDKTVPYEENGALLSKYYRENGGTIFEVVKENCDHHPHGLIDNTPLIKFAEEFY